MVYLPFVFLLLFVPKERFGGLKLKTATMPIGLIINLLVAYLWSNEINKMVYPFGNFEQTTYHNLHEKELPYVTFYDAHGKYSRFAAEGKIDTAILFENVNPEKQKQGILKDPVTFIKNFMPASFELYSYCNKSYVGSVGWESSRLNNIVHILLIVSLLLFLAVQKNIFVNWEKWSLIIVGHTISCAFLLSQILHWDAVGGKITVTYIGKYFIPIFMIFMFAFVGLLYRFDAFFKKRRLDLVLSLVIIIAYLDMIYITIHRFYGLF